MSATFWEYDARLGRRFNLDPKPNPWESHYSVMGNNPIYYNDILGDKIGKGKEHHDALVKEVTGLRDQSKNKEATLTKKLNDAKPNSKKATDAKRDLDAAKQRTADLDATLIELDEMDKDTKTTFNYFEWDKSGGETTGENGEINMYFGSEDYYGGMAHEAKHGHQFLKGEITFKNGGASGMTHDLTDEAEGYKRQFLISPNSVVASNWYNKNGTSEVTLDGVKSFNPGYANLPKIRLNTSSDINLINKEKSLSLEGMENKMNYVEYQKTLRYEDNFKEMYR